MDYVAFLTTAGTAQVVVTNWERGANLHLNAALYNSAGVLVTNVESVDDSGGVHAITFSALVSNGTNYIAIDGLGSGDPLTTGYSDYASLGQYNLSITLPASSSWLPTVAGVYAWTNPANWLAGNVPNTTDTTANFTTIITGDQFITLDAPLTIGQLLLGNTAATNAYFLQTGAGGTLTFDVVGGAASLLKYGPGADEIGASLSLADSLLISNGVAANMKISGAISGTGSLVKMGGGQLTLSATSSFSGALTVSNGTLNLAPGTLLASPLLDLRSGALLSVPGGYTVIGGQTLAGRGAVTGDVTLAAAATLAPGNTNAAGTLTFSNSLILGGAKWNVDLAATVGLGGDTNDLVTIAGDLILNGSNLITVNALDSSLAVPGTYTIATYGGTLTGSAANLVVTNSTRLLITPDTSTPGEIRLIVTGASANLVWRGDNSGNVWNVADKTNWLNGAANDQFFQFDTVTFDDTGSNTSPVNLTANLRPTALTVNATKNFIFNGIGKLTGPMPLTKLGAGLLTVSNANDFSGMLTISGGTLKVANSNALGLTASAAFVTNTGTLDLNGFNLGAKPLVVTGQGTGGGAIVNSGGAQTNAVKNLTLTGNVLLSATNRWDIRAGALNANGFALAKSGASDLWLVGLGSTGFGDMEVRQGVLGIQGTTTLGSATNTLALWNGTTLSLADNGANVLNKNILATNATVTSGSGSNVLAGTLAANGTLGLAVTTQLELRSALTGAGTITKSGAGNLLLNGTNLCTGIFNLDSSSTASNEGWVRVTNSKALLNFASPLFIRANNTGFSTLQMDAGVTVTQAIQLSGRNTNVAAIQNLGGSNTLSGGFILQVGGANYWLQSDAGTLVLDGQIPISLPNTSGRTLTFLGAGNHLVKGTLQDGTGGGVVGLIKTNAGTLTLAGTNTYSRFTLLSQGVIDVFSSRAFGTGTITNDAGTNTSRIVLESGVTVTNAIVANTVNAGVSLGLLMVNGNVSATFSGPITFNSNALTGGHIVGPTTGAPLSFSGPITLPAGIPLIIRSGNVRFSGGGDYTEIQPRSQTTSLGATNGLATNAVIDLAGNGSTTTPTVLDLNGFNQTLAGLKNLVTSNNAAWVTNSLTTTNTMTLALGTSNFFYGGSIIGRVALTLNSGTQVLGKSGTSTLNGLYTYNGQTVINGGTLALATGMTLPNTPAITLGGGMLDVSASGFILAAAQSLQGNGTVLGNLIVNGTVAPGFAFGTLVASNNVTLNAASKTLMEINRSPTTNDLLQVAGTLTYGGTLTVSNLGGALQPGDTFKLFSAANYTGAFAATNLPTLPLGQGWKFTGTNGTLTLLQLIATNATNLNYTVASNTLQITWPTDHVGWTLQAQTNTLEVGLGTNWVSLAGTSATNSFSAPLTATNRTVFYRLKFP